ERADAAGRRGAGHGRPRGPSGGRPRRHLGDERGRRHRGHARRRRPRARHQRRRSRTGVRRPGGRDQQRRDRHDADVGGLPAHRRHRGPDPAGPRRTGGRLPGQLGLDAAVGARQDHRGRARAAAGARLQPL
ncbi:MAG: PaaD-like protein (DUF59) involved in Fe-S cluster assembly, partial [uncultured Nocardioidaceae bacterium]